MASCRTRSWHINEGKVETVADFIFLGSKTTMDLDCSHKIKRHLHLGKKKGYDKPEQCIKKQRLNFATEVCSVTAMILPVIMYRCAIWTIRKGECQRTELLNFGAWEDSWESLIQQGDQTSQSERKSTSDHCCLSWGIYWGSPGVKNGCFHCKIAWPWQLQANSL